MPSSQATTSLLLLTLSISLLLTNGTAVKATTADAPSPAPPPPVNITDILKNATQYNTFIRLLKDTEVAPQLASLLDSERNADGLTVLAPTDNAFNGLKSGTLNRFNAQDQAELVLFHTLPKFYTYITFQTTSNPVRTQASGEHGVCTVNITSGSNQVNVSSGLMETSLSAVLYLEYPLAVYSIDKVLLPPDLFGPYAKKHKAEAPVGAGKPHNQTPSSAASDAPAREADVTATSGAGRRVGWVPFVGVVVLAASLSY